MVERELENSDHIEIDLEELNGGCRSNLKSASIVVFNSDDVS